MCHLARVRRERNFNLARSHSSAHPSILSWAGEIGWVAVAGLRLGDNDALGADSLQPWEARQCRTKSWRVRHSAPFLALRDAALAAAGISTQDASEYERLANVPQEDFETALSDLVRGQQEA
jgi:hypothetical protein